MLYINQKGKSIMNPFWGYARAEAFQVIMCE